MLNLVAPTTPLVHWFLVRDKENEAWTLGCEKVAYLAVKDEESLELRYFVWDGAAIVETGDPWTVDVTQQGIKPPSKMFQNACDRLNEVLNIDGS